MSKTKTKKVKAAKPKATPTAKSSDREARGIPGLNLTASLRAFFASPKGHTSAEAVQHVLSLTKGSKAANGSPYTEAHAIDRVKKVLLGMSKNGKLKTGGQTKDGSERFIYTGGPVIRKERATAKSPPKDASSTTDGGMKRGAGKAVKAPKGASGPKADPLPRENEAADPLDLALGE